MKLVHWAAVWVCLAVTATLVAQNGVQRTVVQRMDGSVPGREILSVRVEFATGASSGRHIHPGDEIDYVVDGEGEWLVEGQANRKAKAGDSIIIPGGLVHEARNTGASPLKVRAVFMVEKGKPLTTAAP
jgi:quercetin dioxygenase-like cupin family protein